MRLLLMLLPALLLAACDDGWNTPVDDDDATVDDDDTVADDDDTVADDDDATTDDDDATVDDDDATVDDDDATADDDDTVDDDDTSVDDDDTANPDADGDGYVDEGSGGDDCDDTNDQIHPNQTENPGNSIDDDCDGATDEMLTITSLEPDDGIAGGGTVVTIHGSGMTGVFSVTVGGTAVTDLDLIDDTMVEVTTPAGTVGTAAVVVGNAYSTVNAPDFVYTGDQSNIDAAQLLCEGSLCATSTVPVDCTNPGVPTGMYSATVTEAGVTDALTESASIVAEVGKGTQGWFPTNAPDFYSWSAATFVSGDGTSHTYEGSLTPDTYGTFVVTFRFSDDDGVNWIYADAQGAQPPAVVDMGALDVVPTSVSCP